MNTIKHFVDPVWLWIYYLLLSGSQRLESTTKGKNQPPGEKYLKTQKENCCSYFCPSVFKFLSSWALHDWDPLVASSIFQFFPTFVQAGFFPSIWTLPGGDLRLCPLRLSSLHCAGSLGVIFFPHSSQVHQVKHITCIPNLKQPKLSFQNQFSILFFVFSILMNGASVYQHPRGHLQPSHPHPVHQKN